ncbi:MAG TPA: hypothetical protein VFE53_23940 [Mucilaginibacter sp.]|jgi:hypothetical protein|nr:hypothetical protein [Mucilaginibacter sp.]
MTRKITWGVFILLGLYMGFQAHVLKFATCREYTIVQLETANKCRGQAILKEWKSLPYGEGTVLDVARSNTYWDFLFILCYVTMIVIQSYNQMQREKWMFLNALLRLNLFLAFLAGFFDICENSMLLHNFSHVADGRYYLETRWATWPKFILSGWAVLAWLVSLVKSWF